MSTPASVKDEEGKDQTMNFSGNKSGDQQTKMSKEEEQEPSTAVIQMTIQPQPTSSAETQAAAPEALADAPAEIPLELLDAIPEVEPSEDLAFGIPEEAIVRPLERAASFDYIAEPEVAIGPFVGVPARRGPAPPPTSRPRFSYRSDAAQAQPSCSSFGGTAQSAHTYDYTDEGEFALERALAAIDQPPEELPEESPLEETSPPPDQPPLDPVSLYHELALNFDLNDRSQLPSDPPSVEYSENGATLQSELFELGQAGFAEEPSAPTGEDSCAAVAAAPEPQAGPSGLRAHAVQLYPGGGEGEPHTCYVTNLPRLEFEASFLEEGESRAVSLPLQVRPVPASLGQHAAGDLAALFASAEAGGSASDDSSEPNKDKPDTIAEALRSAAISFAGIDIDDSQSPVDTSGIEPAAASQVTPADGNATDSVEITPINTNTPEVMAVTPTEESEPTLTASTDSDRYESAAVAITQAPQEDQMAVVGAFSIHYDIAKHTSIVIKQHAGPVISVQEDISAGVKPLDLDAGTVPIEEDISSNVTPIDEGAGTVPIKVDISAGVQLLDQDAKTVPIEEDVSARVEPLDQDAETVPIDKDISAGVKPLDLDAGTVPIEEDISSNVTPIDEGAGTVPIEEDISAGVQPLDQDAKTVPIEEDISAGVQPLDQDAKTVPIEEDISARVQPLDQDAETVPIDEDICAGVKPLDQNAGTVPIEENISTEVKPLDQEAETIIPVAAVAEEAEFVSAAAIPPVMDNEETITPMQEINPDTAGVTPAKENESTSAEHTPAELNANESVTAVVMSTDDAAKVDKLVVASDSPKKSKSKKPKRKRAASQSVPRKSKSAKKARATQNTTSVAAIAAGKTEELLAAMADESAGSDSIALIHFTAAGATASTKSTTAAATVATATVATATPTATGPATTATTATTAIAITAATFTTATAAAAPIETTTEDLPKKLVSSKKTKGKRVASAQPAKARKNKQAKKVRPAEVPTTAMVLRSRSHLI